MYRDIHYNVCNSLKDKQVSQGEQLNCYIAHYGIQCNSSRYKTDLYVQTWIVLSDLLIEKPSFVINVKDVTHFLKKHKNNTTYFLGIYLSRFGGKNLEEHTLDNQQQHCRVKVKDRGWWSKRNFSFICNIQLRCYTSLSRKNSPITSKNKLFEKFQN